MVILLTDGGINLHIELARGVGRYFIGVVDFQQNILIDTLCGNTQIFGHDTIKC